VLTEQPSLAQVVRECGRRQPILLLQPGLDPVAQVRAAAEQELGTSEHVEFLCLGDGQGQRATKLLQNSLTLGRWTVIQNLHEAVDWLPTLEQLVDAICSNTKLKVHPKFQLFLTSASVATPIVRRCVKLVHEEPAGIRSHLRELLNSAQSDLGSSSRSVARAVAALSVFHCVRRERGLNRGVSDPAGTHRQFDFACHLLRLVENHWEDSVQPWRALVELGGLAYTGELEDLVASQEVATLFARFLSDEVTQEGDYVFAKGYTLPAAFGTSTTDPELVADPMPTMDSAEILAVHPYNLQTAQLDQAASMIRMLLAMRPLQVTVAPARPAVGTRTQDLLEVLAKVAADLPPVDAFQITRPTGQDGAVTAFLLAECGRCEAFLAFLRESMEKLQAHGQGLGAHDLESAECLSSLLAGKVPQHWVNNGYPTALPVASWLVHLRRRVEFLRVWYSKGVDPPCHDISHYFSPLGFLLAVRRAASRRTGVPVDEVTLIHQVESLISDPADLLGSQAEGVLTLGCFLQGARWDIHTHRLEFAPGEAFSALPAIRFVPMVGAAPNTNIYTYACPLYRTCRGPGPRGATRQPVSMIDLNTVVPPEIWILEEVSLVCEPPEI